MTPERGERITVDVEGRTLTLSSLDRVVYPATGTTKGEVLAYYATVAPVLLRQLADRPATRLRWPSGVDGPSFFEKNVPNGVPDWVRTVTLETPGSSRDRDRITFPIITDLASLTWVANLNALELHTPQWRVDDAGRPMPPDRLVIDLDPGPPAGLSECAEAALLVRDALAEDGLTDVVPVTSGSKGLQLYAPLPGTADADTVRDQARELAERLAGAHPHLLLSVMTKAKRSGRVLLDWSQNSAAKTTITPYSLRGKMTIPFVAAPRSWDEIGTAPLRQLGPDDIVSRLGAPDLMMQ